MPRSLDGDGGGTRQEKPIGLPEERGDDRRRFSEANPKKVTWQIDLPTRMRPIGIRVSPEFPGLNDLPGSRVDIIHCFSRDENWMSELLFEDLLVIGVGVQERDSGQPWFAVITVAVAPEGVEKLLIAKENGHLRIETRKSNWRARPGCVLRPWRSHSLAGLKAGPSLSP